jgi:hypothetical protein
MGIARAPVWQGFVSNAGKGENPTPYFDSPDVWRVPEFVSNLRIDAFQAGSERKMAEKILIFLSVNPQIKFSIEQDLEGAVPKEIRGPLHVSGG